MISSAKKMEIRGLISEANKWVSLVLSEGGSGLYSPLLNPEVDLWDYVTSDKSKEEVVLTVCRRRAELIVNNEVNTGATKISGRVLCFYPELSLQDAVAYVASDGFIDQDDCPPWDTWLFYSNKDIEMYHDDEHSCLYSWVPEMFVSQVNNAISEDTYDCLVWAEVLEKQLEISHSSEGT